MLSIRGRTLSHIQIEYSTEIEVVSNMAFDSRAFKRNRSDRDGGVGKEAKKGQRWGRMGPGLDIESNRICKLHIFQSTFDCESWFGISQANAPPFTSRYLCDSAKWISAVGNMEAADAFRAAHRRPEPLLVHAPKRNGIDAHASIPSNAIARGHIIIGWHSALAHTTSALVVWVCLWQ